MTFSNDDNEIGRALWRRHRPDPEMAEPIDGYDATLLAAWLDNELSDEDWAALETRLSTRPDLVGVLRDAVRLTSDVAEPLPAPLAARLKKLAPAAAAPARRARPRPWRGLLEWSTAAAALVAVALIGFDLGSATGVNSTQAETVASNSVTADFETPFDTYLQTSSVGYLIDGDER